MKTSLSTLAVLSSLLSASHGVILLQDNFNAATPNTNDLNVDLARQTGTLAAVPYNLAFGPGHYAHQLQNGNAINQLLVADFGNSTSSLNFNFNGANSAGGLRISFDVDPNPAVYANGDDTIWGALNFGASGADQQVNVNGPQTHFGILFRRSNVLQAFDGNVTLTGVEPTYSSVAGAGMRHVEIFFSDTDGNPFDGVGSTQIDVYGDVNAFATPVYSFNKGAGGYANNFMNIQGLFRAHFDNLTITQIPEPASVTLAGAAGLLLLSRRRRA